MQSTYVKIKKKYHVIEINNSRHIGMMRDFPGGARGKELDCQCRRHKRPGLDPWVGQIPWRRAWQPTPVFLPGESPRTEEPDRLTVHGVAELDTTERLSIAQGDGVGLSVTRSANGFKVLQ